MCFEKMYSLMYTMVYDCLYPDDIKYQNFGGLLDGPRLPMPFIESECECSDIESFILKEDLVFIPQIYESGPEI